jgi:hypothetical protein
VIHTNGLHVFLKANGGGVDREAFGSCHHVSHEKVHAVLEQEYATQIIERGGRNLEGGGDGLSALREIRVETTCTEPIVWSVEHSRRTRETR